MFTLHYQTRRGGHMMHRVPKMAELVPRLKRLRCEAVVRDAGDGDAICGGVFKHPETGHWCWWYWNPERTA